jgi:putative ABC transport system permease protein
MFKNYLTSAIRSIRRHRLFSFINIFGLAAGMACSILILLWVQDERSYDKFNTNEPQLYRLTAEVSGVKTAVIGGPVAPMLKQQMPAVKNYARVMQRDFVVTIGTQKFDEKNILYVDPGFLQMFTYPLISGDIKAALSRPDGVVITEETARKYFGTENAIGKVIHADDDVKSHDYVVTGVLKDVPHNSHLQFDILLPFVAFEHSTYYGYNNPEEWSNQIMYTYLQLDDKFNANNQSISALEQQINTIHRDNDPTHMKTSYILQPLGDIHLHSNYLLDVAGQGNAQSVNIFSMVAIFILLIACINFINLSTALSGQRAKEVGLRKTVGALRGQLIIQFLGESLLMSLISLVIGVAIAWMLLPMFNELSSKHITVDLLNLRIIASLLGVAVLAGLISGSYPALFLSSFNPVKVLKGMRIFEGRKTWLRNGLVVFQFSISVILMVSTLVVNSQLSFIRNRDIGFNKANLLYLKMPTVGDLQQNFSAIKATLGQNTSIDNYTLIEHLPTDLTTGTTDVKWAGKDPHQQIVFPHIGVDGNFIKVFGMHLAAGRTFEDNNPSDAANYILNETAVKTMGMTTANAVGKQITMNGNLGEIIGVVKDFNFKPVQQLIQPLVLRYVNHGGFVVTKANPANLQRAIDGMKASFKDVYHDYPFSYGFVDQDIDSLYRSEQRMGKLFNIFSIVSIVVSCLGLFGLATFATQRRIKEIGVRRVLGATSAGLVALLARDFIKLVLLALVVGFPLAWWAMTGWLNNYVYRINMSWWMFALAGVAAMLISLFTISYQSIKAAMANPVNSLRSE